MKIKKYLKKQNGLILMKSNTPKISIVSTEEQRKQQMENVMTKEKITNIYAFRSVLSLITSFFMIYKSTISAVFYDGWASEEAIFPAMHLFTLYNVLDIGLELNTAKKHRSLSIIIHHFVCLIASGMFYYSTAEAYEDHIYRLIWWLIIAEVSTIFNNFRILFKHTDFAHSTKIAFGISFLVARSIMSIGCLWEMLTTTYSHNLIMHGIVYSFVSLNVYWMYLMITKGFLTLGPRQRQHDKNK
jgi:hypothetical protein